MSKIFFSSLFRGICAAGLYVDLARVHARSFALSS
jgi:hypothetical protein